jgi:hypothetical protein
MSSSPAPSSRASPVLPALPIHTALLLEASLRASVASITAEGSQEVEQLLLSDMWLPSSPLKGPPPSPIIRRPHTPIGKVVGMVVSSLLSPPPTIDEDVAL